MSKMDLQLSNDANVKRYEEEEIDESDSNSLNLKSEDLLDSDDDINEEDIRDWLEEIEDETIVNKVLTQLRQEDESRITINSDDLKRALSE